MARIESQEGVEVLRTFTDVLFLTNEGQMPAAMKRLLKRKRLSHAVLGIDRYPEIRDRLDLVGTVIIDVEELDTSLRTSGLFF